MAQRHLLLLLLLLSGILLTNCTRGDRVIENPEHGLTNTNAIAISKIILTDTAAIVHFNVYLRGGGIMVHPDVYFLEANGELFAITGAEGIILYEPHEANPVSEEGGHSFVLFFEPLPRNLRSVNFIGIDCPQCWGIWDINLTNRSRRFTPNLPADIRNFRADNNITLPEPKMEIGTTTVTVHINGLRDGFALRTPQMRVFNIFTLERETINAQEIETGKYVFEFEQFGTTRAFIPIGSHAGDVFFVDIYLSPGESAEMFIDMEALSIAHSRYNPRPNVVYAGFRGEFAQINTQLFRIGFDEEIRRYRNINIENSPEVFTMSSQEVIDFMYNIYSENLAQLQNFNLSPGVRQGLETNLKVHLVLHIVHMRHLLANAYRHHHNLQWNAPMDFEAPEATEEELISVLKKLDINNPMNMYSQNFGFGIVLPALFFSPEMLNEITGTDRGFLQDMQKAHPLIGKAQRVIELSEEEMEILNSTSSPIFAQVYHHIFENSRRRMEEAMLRDGFEIVEVPNVSNDRILETILAKHRGKPIFVNFWAIWCGPCIRAKEIMVPLKAEMKEQGVVMIFIANESSPKATWLEMLPDIGGIHYYLTNEQWTALSSRYQIQGFPTYMIFDKTGTRTFKRAGFPGNDSMREELARVW